MKNKNVTSSKADGTRATGNNKPLVNLPANNVGTYPVTLGAGQKNSKFSHSRGSGNTPASHNGPNKANLSTHNNGQKTVPLGTRKHGVGGVPDYLKGRH